MAEQVAKDTFRVGQRVRDKRSGWMGYIVKRGLGFAAWGVLWDRGGLMNMFGHELEAI